MNNTALEKLSEEFGATIRLLEQAASTNDIAAETCFHEGDVVIALEQTHGRGQRGSTWSAEKGLNLTFSMVLEPDFLPAGRQFLISQAVSLAIADCLWHRSIGATVKWPNDIYIGDRKIAGILIEHTVSGTELQRSVVGIGLNINQTRFDPSLPNPTSLALETGRGANSGEGVGAVGAQTDIFDLFDELYRCLLARYALLLERDFEHIEEDYRGSLYLLDTPHTFTIAGRPIEGIIRGVGEYGQLIVEHPAAKGPGNTKSYLFKEIAF